MFKLSSFFLSILLISPLLSSAQRCGSDLSFRIIDNGTIYPLPNDSTYELGIENKLLYEKFKIIVLKIEGNAGDGKVNLNVRKNHFSINTGCGINHLELKIVVNSQEMILKFDSLHGDIDFIADSIEFTKIGYSYNGNKLFDSIKKIDPKAQQPYCFTSKTNKADQLPIPGNYKNQYLECLDLVINKNGTFYYPAEKTIEKKKRKGKWEMVGGLLHLTCEYEIYKENKNKKIVNFDFPAYQKIKESKYFQINGKELIEVYETGVPIKSKCFKFILVE